MSIYSLALFIHIISDITLFIGIGAQLLVRMTLRRASDMSQLNAVIGLIPITDGMGVVGSLFTIISGFYMARVVWGLQTSWIMVALASIVLFIGPSVGAVVEPRNRALVKLAKETQGSTIPPTLQSHIRDRILAVALQINLAIVVGIVFLMTNKPALTESIITIVTAFVLGALSGLPLWYVTRRNSVS